MKRQGLLPAAAQPGDRRVGLAFMRERTFIEKHDPTGNGRIPSGNLMAGCQVKPSESRAEVFQAPALGRLPHRDACELSGGSDGFFIVTGFFPGIFFRRGVT